MMTALDSFVMRAVTVDTMDRAAGAATRNVFYAEQQKELMEARKISHFCTKEEIEKLKTLEAAFREAKCEYLGYKNDLLYKAEQCELMSSETPIY